MSAISSRRSRGEGSIYRVANGTWRGAILVAGRRRYVSGRTRSEVSRRVAQVRDEAARGLTGAGKRTTVGEQLDVWLGAVRTRVRPSTFRGYEQHVRTNIRPLVGAITLAQLTPTEVEAMQAQIMRTGRSARTARMARIVLASALGDAVRDGLVARNAAKLARPPRVERPELRVLTADEVREFLRFTEDHPDGPLYALAVASGLRQGELLGLSWPDVDLGVGQLTVRRSLARNADGHFALSPPKTQRSRRTIALPAVGVQALQRQRHRRDEMVGAAGSAWQDRDDLVFTDAVGRPLMGYNVTRDFSKVLRRAALPHIRFHDLRHTMATLAIGSGASLRTVSDALGHSSITVTADVYAHVTPEMKREVATALDGALSHE